MYIPVPKQRVKRFRISRAPSTFRIRVLSRGTGAIVVSRKQFGQKQASSSTFLVEQRAFL